MGNQRTLGFKHRAETKLAIQRSAFGNQKTRGKRYNSEGRRIGHDGYIWIRVEGQTDEDGHVLWKLEHHVVWESTYGVLAKGLLVHHLNHNRADNRLENLRAMTISEHRTLHMAEQPRNARGQLVRVNA